MITDPFYALMIAFDLARPLSSSSLGTWSSAVATASWRQSCGPSTTGTTHPRTAATLAATPSGGETDDSSPLAGPPNILMTPFLQIRFDFYYYFVVKHGSCVPEAVFKEEKHGVWGPYAGVDYYNLI
jgi:hypothetical protein